MNENAFHLQAKLCVTFSRSYSALYSHIGHRQSQSSTIQTSNKQMPSFCEFLKMTVLFLSPPQLYLYGVGSSEQVVSMYRATAILITIFSCL